MNDVYFQKLYGDLINWRGIKLRKTKPNDLHKDKVIGGHIRMLALINRGIKLNKRGEK